HVLSEPISLNLKNAPLKGVIEDLNGLSGISVHPDLDALHEAGVDMMAPLSLKVENISLKSALNLLLKQVKLTYVVKDEAVEITTEEHAKGRLKQVTYPVADLVTPVAELLPVVCQVTETMFGEHDSRKTSEDVLIRLIVETIQPGSWRENGGKGAIAYFPLGM